MHYKIIKDIVHGYIRIPYAYFSEIIDTEVFQRLRRIEQTSMRILYPSARHDRFIHSLGTYYLGEKAFSCLIENIKRDKLYIAEDNSFWKKTKVLFTLACLLHDCAHAPFSHSFEYSYMIAKDDNVRIRLSSLFSNSDYKNDISENRAAEHEMASAIVVKDYFSEKIIKILKSYEDELSNDLDDGFDDSIEFIVRCIVGCQYKNKIDKHKQYKNCLISLLNSSSFDVDKLDYIIRDSVLSGIDNVSIDVDRLLGSLTIVEINEIDGDIQGEVNGILMGNFSGTLGENDNKCDVNIKMSGPNEINLSIYGKVSYEIKGSSVETEGKFKHDEFRNVSKSIFSKISGTACNTEVSGLIDGNINKSLLDGYINGYIKCKFKGEILGKLSWENYKIRYEIGFNKSSLSVIQDTISARNRLYIWVYTHHKVVYADYLLRKSVLLGIENYFKQAGKDLKPQEEEKIDYKNSLASIICVENLLDKSSNFYLADDGDFTYLIKNYALKSDKSEIAVEWLSRRYKNSIWKSFAEYNAIFETLSSEERLSLKKLVFADTQKEGSTKNEDKSILKKYLGDNKMVGEFVWIEAKAKVNIFNVDKTYVRFSENVVKRLKDIMENDKGIAHYTKDGFFYLYYDIGFTKEDNEKLVKFLINEVRNSNSVNI